MSGVCIVFVYSVCACSAGSRYWQSGSFEVSKADTEVVDTPESSHSALRVTVLTELEGVAYIQVAIRESTDVVGGNGKACPCFWLLILFLQSLLCSCLLSLYHFNVTVFFLQ